MFEIDFTKPVVAASEFAAGDRIVRAGEVFDWRAHGMSEVEIVPLVRAGIVRQPTGLDPLDELAMLSEECVGCDEPAPAAAVQTPTQRDARRGKRR